MLNLIEDFYYHTLERKEKKGWDVKKWEKRLGKAGEPKAYVPG
jgi:hypothetical protein